jgi:hypothetical protein
VMVPTTGTSSTPQRTAPSCIKAPG